MNRDLLADYCVGFAFLAEPFLFLLVSIIVPWMLAILHPEAGLVCDLFASLTVAFAMNLKNLPARRDHVRDKSCCEL